MTIIILIITGLVSYMAFNNQKLFRKLMHHPYSENRDKSFYRLLTSGFIHGSFVHLVLNAYVLYEFGTIVEGIYGQYLGQPFGSIAFVIMYVVTIVAANIPTHFRYRHDNGYAAIGASGGVSGVLFAYVIFYPWSWLGIMFVIPCPAIVFAVLYLVYSSWASKNANDNIGHDAHFYGAVFGFLITLGLIPEAAQTFLSRITQFTLPNF